MVETWHDSWFEEGSRFIYIVPPHAIDDALPLLVDPRPSETTRVFVGRIELITPAPRRAVEAAMTVGNVSAIKRFGRFLDPILNGMVSENPANADQIQELRAKVHRSFPRERAGNRGPRRIQNRYPNPTEGSIRLVTRETPCSAVRPNVGLL